MTRELRTYRQKRRFPETPEPQGGKSSRGGNMFVVQKHAARRLHYDFRLELNGVLKSWAVTRGPSLDPADKRLAVRTEDHPLDYAGFEGVIPKGNYGAGTVLLWDRGTWKPEGDAAKGLREGKLAFRLDGQRMKGKWALVRMRPEGKRENWLLIKEKDSFAGTQETLTEAFTNSVKSKRDLEQIADAPSPARSKKSGKTAPPPKFQTPQLATLVEDLPGGDGWVFEIKFDGYRALISASGEKVHVYTRSGLDWSSKFPGIAEAVRNLSLNGVLMDGEIVALDARGRSDFGRLQKALRDGKGKLSLFAFDLLFEDGEDLREKPLRHRKKQLAALLGKGRSGPVYYTDHIAKADQRMLQTLCSKGFEGVIAKRGNAAYSGKRDRNWLKIKCDKDQEMVIGGYSPSPRGRSFASLLLGTYEKGKLKYAGRVGTGFDSADFADLEQRFSSLKRSTPPFQNPDLIPAPIRKKAVWLSPKLVAQIGIAEFTGDGLVRHARYLGLRRDKPAKKVAKEKPRDAS